MNITRDMKKSVAVLLFLMLLASAAVAMNKETSGVNQNRSAAKIAAAPNSQNCSHRMGNAWMTITNWGFFGSEFNQNQLTELYCLGPGVVPRSLAPSFEFPSGSGVNYLFQGALWFGAIVGEDTLVSVGADGWQWVNEMYPEAPPNGGIVQRSNRSTSDYYSKDAISEQDFIAEYTDTLVDDNYTGRDQMDNRSHIPIGIKLIQNSYSWSYSYAEDFILIDYKVVNITSKEIRKAYMGLYIDGDVWHAITPNGFADDITGFKATVPDPGCKEMQDEVNLAWIADNDGDPNAEGVFDRYSPVGVSGSRVVRSPNPDLNYSYNWWVSNGDASLDWGPRRRENNRNFGTGGLGTPEGDRNKYYIMSIREFDYDQIYSAVDHSADGWLPPNANIASDLADGYDTRYLLCFGPFDIMPGDTLAITIAQIGGDKFHVKPDDFQKYFDANNPQAFYDRLDFSDFATNAQWAAWVYDNPGVDTDGDGFRGNPTMNICNPADTIWSGDGKPDFQGPPPPPPPVLKYSSSPGKVTIRWNGHASENTQDNFSKKIDFEGYRVYMGQKLTLADFALLTSFDHYDFSQHQLNLGYSPARWEVTETPFTLDSLKAMYGQTFDPLMYPNGSDSLVWIEGTDTNYYYFTAQDYNRSTLGGSGEIRRIYPDATPTDSIWDEMEQAKVPAYYEYEYSIDGLLASRPVYMAVTTFDFGNPATNLAPLESSPLANAVQIYPVNSPDVVTQQNLKVTVFPNPYKINGGYAEAGYEDVGASLSPDRARRIYFANLPSKATIRIYTLDGDLVRELEHPQPVGSVLYAGESMTAWDLISRNTQAVVSGIYLYTVESELGTQVGKFVIIK